MQPLGSSDWDSWIRTFWKSTNFDLSMSNEKRRRLAQTLFLQTAGWVYWKRPDEIVNSRLCFSTDYSTRTGRVLLPTPKSFTLNCCSTSLTTVWQSMHTKVPATSSGCTGCVLTTWPEILTSDPILEVVNWRMLTLVGTSVNPT
ncbi:unnamed protein product [Nesidiocoris tenuis]|uniref:Uncharacterized protein n=1 Tax=Nesidiocoris tenuis TaxID=355587 RepID=A0A6H5HK39_9HEMI|nr:unnamed protein product [Nesidiocoris tenuis]